MLIESIDPNDSKEVFDMLCDMMRFCISLDVNTL